MKISNRFFELIAHDTYNSIFLKIEDIYAKSEPAEMQDMVAQVISTSVKHTADVWHTVLKSTGMLKRKWSMQSRSKTLKSINSV